MNTKNLTILADWLEANREWIERENRFDMRYYKCGTVHCLAGWATHVPEFDCKAGLFSSDDYYFFAKEVFELTPKEHIFLFGSYWECVDNTLSGAIARIRYLIAGNEITELYEPDLYKSYLPK